MNPRAAMPSAVRRSGPSETRDVTGDRLDGFVVSGARGTGASELIAAPTAIKQLRDDKEPLPEASDVDPDAVLARRPADSAIAPLGPASAPPHPSVDVDFDGGGFGNPATIPPDTHGAPGPDKVMSTLNNRVFWFDRSGTAIADTSLDAFWNVFPDRIDTFDPKLFFDELSGRFIAVVCANAQDPTSSVLVAVSHTDDCLGNWSFGRIQVDDASMGPVWLDYPSVGFTEDKITIGLNRFTRAANMFEGAAVFVIDKAAFLDPPHSFVFDQFVLDDFGGTLCPAIVADPGVSDQYLISHWAGDINGNGFLQLLRITGTVAADDTTLDRVGFLEVDGNWTFSGGDIAPQQGTTTLINCGDARMHWVVQRHDRLFAAHTIFVPEGAPTRAAVQWLEVTDLSGTPAVSDQGGFGGVGEDEFYAFPSLAINAQNDVLIGMAAFSDSTFASGAWSYRPSGGAFTAPDVFAPGQNTYGLTFGGTRNRWGDYSSTHVDPADGQSYWTIQEYAGAAGDTWETRWARISVSGAPIS